MSVSALTSFMMRARASVKSGIVLSSSSVTRRPTTLASSWCSGPVPAELHDCAGSGLVRSLSGIVTAGNAASNAPVSSMRSRASASMRATRYARSCCWTATDTGLPFTSTASGLSGGRRVWSTVVA